MTKPVNTKEPKTTAKAQENADIIGHYTSTQTPEHAGICQVLRAEIDAALPRATSKIWHAIPVWFIGENPVVGYNVTAKKGVNLLFWNGQSFNEPALAAAGKFKAAQIQLTEASQIDSNALRRWLKKAKTDIWDLKALRSSCKS